MKLIKEMFQETLTGNKEKTIPEIGSRSEKSQSDERKA